MDSQQNNSTTLILVVGVCFSCMLSIGALVFAYYQGWLDNIIDWFNGEEEEQTPAPTTNENPSTNNNTNTQDESTSPSNDESTSPSNDESTAPTTTGCNPDDPDKQCTNRSGKHHVCPEPWKRGFLKYSTNGKGVRCCKNKNQKYDDCAKEALPVPDGFPTDELHKNATTALSGKIKGPLEKKQCPDGSGTESIVYLERNARGNVQQTWCHPLSAKKAYAVYPMCYTANSGGSYAKSSGSNSVFYKSDGKCTNGKKVRWEPYDKAQPNGGRHRYVVGGAN